MKDILWTLFELCINFYQQTIIVKTLAMCLEHKFDQKRHLRYTWSFIGILFVELTWLNHLIPFEGLGIFINIFILYVYAEICLCGQRPQKIFWSTSIMIMVIGITAVVLNFESSIIGCTYLELVKGRTLERFVGVLIIQIIIFFLLWLVARVFGKSHRQILKWKEWLLIMVIPLISIFTMVFVTGNVVTERNELSLLQKKFAVMAILGIMITNLMVYVLYQKLQKEHEKRLSIEMLKQTLQSQEDNAKELEELYFLIRKSRHDLKSQIITLRSMLEEKKYEEAIAYIRAYDVEVLNGIGIKLFCENEVINHLINSKYRVCLKNNIQMYVIMCSCIPDISNVDLCILIGNALDNAIEGCVSKNKKEIYMDMRLVDNFFVIQIKNTIINSVLEQNSDLKTTKKERFLHGFGILSMREITEKYRGSVVFSEENGFFYCDMILDVGVDSF